MRSSWATLRWWTTTCDVSCDLSIAFNEGTIDDIRVAIDQLPPRSSGFVELFGLMRDLLDVPDEALRFLTELADAPNRIWPSKYENIALVALWLGYPEFKQFLRDVNLVQYWRNHGWSDYCRPYGDEDFICE